MIRAIVSNSFIITVQFSPKALLCVKRVDVNHNFKCWKYCGAQPIPSVNDPMTTTVVWMLKKTPLCPHCSCPPPVAAAVQNSGPRELLHEYFNLRPRCSKKLLLIHSPSVIFLPGLNAPNWVLNGMRSQLYWVDTNVLYCSSHLENIYRVNE